MKKVNKILMATVAILLSLVLISTSVLSSVFARFVNSRGIDATMKFKKLGVELSLTYDATKLAAAGATVTPTKNGDFLSLSISGLKMAPGDNLKDVIKFTFSENSVAGVPLKVVIDIDVNYNVSEFLIPKGIGHNLAGNHYFLPVSCNYNLLDYTGSKASYYYDYFLYSYNGLSGTMDNTTGEHDASICLRDDMYYIDPTTGQGSYQAVLTGEVDSKTGWVDYAVEKVFAEGQAVKFGTPTGLMANKFYFGFSWLPDPTEVNGKYGEYDIGLIEAYIASKQTIPAMSVSYTFRIEQVASNYQPTPYVSGS